MAVLRNIQNAIAKAIAALRAPAPYLGQVATRCWFPNSSINGASAKFDSGRKCLYLFESFTQLKIVFSNVSAGGSNVETLIAGGTIRASVENMLTGAITQGDGDISFVNGFAVCTVTFASPITGWVGIRFKRNSPNGITFEGCPHNGTHPLDGWTFSTNDVTDYTQGGTPPQGFLRSQGYGPCLVLGMTSRPSIVQWGTSRPFGIADYVTDASADIGYARLWGRRFAYANYSIASSQLQTLLTNRTYRDQIRLGTIAGVATGVPYFSHMAMEHLVNDIQAGGRTAAQVAADRATWAALWATTVNIGMTATPVTSSTNNFIDTANQNAATSTNVAVNAGNDLIRAGIAGETMVFDWADLVSPFRTSKFPVSRNPNDASVASASFTGSISGFVLTASAVTGTIPTRACLHGTGVQTNTVIDKQLTGTPGGAGTYQVSLSGTVASTTMTADSSITGDGLHDLVTQNELSRDRGLPLLALITR